MKNLIDIAKREFLRDMPHNGIYTDMILGSGIEAMDLARYADEGRVFGFGTNDDIERACKLFEENSQDNIRFVNDTPDNAEVYLPDTVNGVICRIGDSCPFTKCALINGMNILLGKLKEGGRFLLINHSDRHKEISDFPKTLSFREYFVVNMGLLNDVSAPQCIIIEKR